MKSLRKIFVLAPAMLLALTACEAKMDEAKAKERMESYDAAKVAETYKSFDEKMEIKFTKKTGDFAKGGKMYDQVVLLEALMGEGQTSKDQPVDEGVFDANTINEFGSSATAVGVGSLGDYELAYYSYKTTGLKVTATADAVAEGAKVKASASMYVHDDGRIEKANAKISMTYSEGDYKGTLEMSINATYTWNKK